MSINLILASKLHVSWKCTLYKDTKNSFYPKCHLFPILWEGLTYVGSVFGSVTILIMVEKVFDLLGVEFKKLSDLKRGFKRFDAENVQLPSPPHQILFVCLFVLFFSEHSLSNTPLTVWRFHGKGLYCVMWNGKLVGPKKKSFILCVPERSYQNFDTMLLKK